MADQPGGRWADQPSPEEVFSGEPDPNLRQPIPVHVTDGDTGLSAAPIVGIRAVLTMLRGERVGIKEAEALWDRFKAGERPLLLGEAPTVEAAREAAEKGLEASGKSLTLAYGLSEGEVRALQRRGPEQPPEAPQEPEWPRAARLALILMAQHEGNTQAAYFWATVMARHDPSWEEVRSLLLAAFPPPERAD